MKIIIEHLDDQVYPWSLLEYTHISKTVGKENVLFTNVKRDAEKLKRLGEVQSDRVYELSLDRKKMCVLDPKATELLSPSDGDHFDTFVFGGVLGNHPMDGRTAVELSEKMPDVAIRNLGDVQMSTNTAVLVVKKIIMDKIPFDQIEFKDNIEIEIEEGFSTLLPYRYVVEHDKVVLPDGFIDFLKSEENTF